MFVMLADYGPGGLTSLLIIFGSGFVFAICLIGALISFLIKQKKAAQDFVIAAGVVFLACWLLVITASILGRYFHLV
jgi:hypothetical protein